MNLTLRSKELTKSSDKQSISRSSRTPLAKSLALVALSLLLLVSFTIAIRPAAAATSVTLYVSTSGSDTTGDGSAGSPYATITKGVSVANAGDKVLVGPGAYHEMVNVTKTLSLMSINGDPSNTVIDASGLSMGIFVRGAAAAGTIVQGFTVENANNHGIYAQDTSKIVIEHNIVTNNGLSPNPAFSGEDKAVELVGTSYSVIAGNQVIDNEFGGIAVNDNGPINPGFYSPGTLTASVGNVISGNTVMGNRPNHCAIVISAYNSGAGVINNVISSNLVVDNQNGIVIAANTPNSQAINNSVIFNDIVNNGEAGVILHANSPGALNSGTLVMANTISGNGYGFDINGTGGIVMIAKFTGVLVGGESTKVSPQGATIIRNVFHNQFNAVYVVNGTGTLSYSNTFDSTVTNFVNGTADTQNPFDSRLSTLSGAVSTLQGALKTLQQSAASKSDMSSLTSNLNGLSSSAAKESDLKALSNTVSALQLSQLSQGDLSTTTYIAYAAVALAIISLLVAVLMSRKRP